MRRTKWQGETIYSHTIFSEFLSCDICSGFWISMVTGYYLKPAIVFYFTTIYLDTLVESVLTSLLFLGTLMFYKNVVER